MARVLRMREIWTIAIALFAGMWVFQLFSAFLPEFYETVRAMPMDRAGSLTALVPFAGMFAAAGAGILTGVIGLRRPFTWPMQVLFVLGCLRLGDAHQSGCAQALADSYRGRIFGVAADAQHDRDGAAGNDADQRRVGARSGMVRGLRGRVSFAGHLRRAGGKIWPREGDGRIAGVRIGRDRRIFPGAGNRPRPRPLASYLGRSSDARNRRLTSTRRHGFGSSCRCGHSHAAPRTPLESPWTGGTIGVSNASENT